MASTAGKRNFKEGDSEDDLRLLLDCLQFQQHSVPAQKQALTTIATMCSNSNNTRNLFNNIGGLSYVLELVFCSQASEVKQAALYTLGCASENNLVNQLKLCNERLFSYLTDLIVAPCDALPNTLIMAVAFLSGCLMSNNVQGQKLAKDTGLLSKLITLFRSALPLLESSKTDGAAAVGLKHSPSTHHKLWSSVSSALCAATNNPQNDINQCQCIKLFPAALSVLDVTPLDVSIVRPAISFLASCTANNKGAQDRLRMVGGLKALVNTFQTVIQCHPQFTELSIHIVKTLSAAAFGHSDNCDSLVELNCVELLLRLMQSTDPDDSTKLNTVLCLGMLSEDNVTAQKKVAKSNGLRLLVNVMVNSQSEGLSKATAFLLQCCVDKSPRSAYATAFNEKIAHIDKLLTQAGEFNDSTMSYVSCKSLTQDGLDLLATRKLPTKDLVTAWLDTCVPDSSSPQEEGVDLVVDVVTRDQPVRASTHQPREVAENKVTSAASPAQEVNSQVEVELRREKELREHLEAKLKKEQEKREKLERELLATKNEAIQAEVKGNTKPPLSVRPSTEADTPTPSNKINVRYASSTKPNPLTVKKMVHSSKHSSHPRPPSTVCDNTHSLVNLVYKFSNGRQTKHVTKTAQTQHSANIKGGNEDSKTRVEVWPPEGPHIVKRVPQYSSRIPHQLDERYKPEDHELEECLGCKPRLKCPLINSRNFIKLLRLDHYTCSYHRRIAFKLKGDDVITSSAKSLISHHLSSRLKHHPLVCARHQHLAPPSSPSTTKPDIDPIPEESNDIDPIPEESSEIDPIPEESNNNRDQPSTCNLSTHSSSTNSSLVNSTDPDYSPSSSESTVECNPPADAHLWSQRAETKVIAPPRYRLVPGTVGTFAFNSKKLSRQPVADLTNSQTVKSASGRPLAVFDYIMPQKNLRCQPHDQGSSKLVVKQKATPRKRAKAVPWSSQEVRFLMEGVRLLGTGQWRHILAAYRFHPSRDCSSLRVKYRNMCHKK